MIMTRHMIITSVVQSKCVCVFCVCFGFDVNFVEASRRFAPR